MINKLLNIDHMKQFHIETFLHFYRLYSVGRLWNPNYVLTIHRQ